MFFRKKCVISTLAIGIISSSVLAVGGIPNNDNIPILEEYQQAVTLIESKQYQEAIPLLEKVIKEQPNNPDAYNYLGYVYRNKHNSDFKKSLEYYKKALEIDSNHFITHEYLGHLYLDLENLEQSEKQLMILKRLCSGNECPGAKKLQSNIDVFKKNGTTGVYK